MWGGACFNMKMAFQRCRLAFEVATKRNPERNRRSPFLAFKCRSGCGVVTLLPCSFMQVSSRRLEESAKVGVSHRPSGLRHRLEGLAKVEVSRRPQQVYLHRTCHC